MTLTELVKILDALGVKPFGEAGETFDPQRHNAVMPSRTKASGKTSLQRFSRPALPTAIRSSASPW